MTTITTLRRLNSTLDQSIKTVAKEPMVSRESTAYLSNISKVKSIDAFMADDRTLRYALTAFGLENMANSKGLVRKVLEGGIDNPSSFANQMSDPRFRDFAEAFNFARYGGTTTSFSRTGQGTVDRYVRLKFEESVGKTDEGARLGLYFERKAAGLKSVYSIMADPALLKVVQTALDIPQGSGSDIGKTAARISAKLDIAKLKDPAFVSKLVEKFAARWQVSNAPASPVLSLVSGAGASTSPSLLLAIQSLNKR